MGATGGPKDQFPVEQNLTGGEFRGSDTIEHQTQRGFTDIVRWLMNGRERNRKQAGVRHIIDSDKANVFGYTYFALQKYVHELPCDTVIDAHECLNRVNFVSF